MTVVENAPELQLAASGLGTSTMVRDLMTPDVVTCEESETIEEVAQKMRQNEIGSILVVRDAELQGIVTDRDIVVRALADGRFDAKAGEICTSAPAYVSPDQDYEEAAELMSAHAVRRIPVVQDGVPVGILSLGDLALIDAAAEADSDALTGSFSGDVLADVAAAPANSAQ